MRNKPTSNASKNAKALRTNMTDAERRLWSRLRMGQLGVKFRRQHPIGPFVLDFACLAPKLVVEVDGSQHLDQVAYDERRTTRLEVSGFFVLRFWANEVLVETDAVVSSIVQTLGALAAPTPTLPRKGRESMQREST